MGPLADYWEALLIDQQWLSGEDYPSKADAEALKHLGGKYPNPSLYPNLFGWYSMCGRFQPNRIATWKEGVCPIPAGYVPPKEPIIAASAPSAEESKQAKPAQEEEKKEAQTGGKKQKQGKAEAPAAKPASGGTVDENLDIYQKCDLRVGKIIEAKKHPESDKLYIEQIDLGEGRIRTIGSGLQAHCTIEELL